MAGLEFTRFQPHIIALAIAYVLAIPIGWDRERSDRSAGLRTFPLVAIAACGFVQATERLIAGNPEALARVVEGIIGGIGFIGGGAILKDQASVRGTATAASLLGHRRCRRSRWAGLHRRRRGDQRVHLCHAPLSEAVQDMIVPHIGAVSGQRCG
jgi:uncharacterized membrane protein YhiD involved in acid resistance